jgi:hypothetical protein
VGDDLLKEFFVASHGANLRISGLIPVRRAIGWILEAGCWMLDTGYRMGGVIR